jgi:hypothetical protein
MDDDVDIDVCQGCGRHYGMTQTIADMWRSSPLYREGTVCPQLCHQCMRREHGSQEETHG